MVVLLTCEQIADKVAEIGTRITRDFEGESVVLVGVLKGAAIFLADLTRAIKVDATFDFIGVSSYGNARESSGYLKLVRDIDQSLEDKNVILVEDIIDTGLTLEYLEQQLRTHKPKALRIAVLLDKVSRRIRPVQCDYVGFEIPNEFVVGYGLDFAEHYRNLRDIYMLEQGD